MRTPPADWISRDLQRLDAEGKLARKPTAEEWNDIWHAANEWAEREGEDGEDISIEDFVLNHAPDILEADWHEMLVTERADGSVKPLVPITIKPRRATARQAPRATKPPVVRESWLWRTAREAARGALWTFAGIALLFALIVGGAWWSSRNARLEAPAHAADAAADRAKIDQLIAEKKLSVGFTPEQVERAWGKPKSRSETGGVGASQVFFHYEATTLYFVNGRLVRWTQRQ